MYYCSGGVVSDLRARLSGTPGATGRVSIEVNDPQVHFSFEIFQGLVEMRARLELETAAAKKAIAQGLAPSSQISSAAAAVQRVADAAAHAARSGITPGVSIPSHAGGRPLSDPCLPSIPPFDQEDAELSRQYLDASSAGSPLVGGIARSSDSERWIGRPPSKAEAELARVLHPHIYGSFATNYIVRLGDTTMEGQLLELLITGASTQWPGLGVRQGAQPSALVASAAQPKNGPGRTQERLDMNVVDDLRKLE